MLIDFRTLMRLMSFTSALPASTPEREEVEHGETAESSL